MTITNPGRSRIGGQCSVRRSFAIAIIVLGSASLGAQHPLVTRIPLPPPTCASVNAQSLVVGDYDANGTPDFLYPLLSPPRIGVYLDPATAAAGTPCHVTPLAWAPSTGSPQQLIKANLDGDAYPDLIVRVSGNTSVLEAFGDGSGGFAIPGTGPYPAGALAVYGLGLASADFNSDGRDDFVSFVSGGYEVKLNLPSGWVTSWNQSGTSPAGVISSADFDGDGDLDLFWTEYIPPAYPQRNLRVARGNGDGTFVLDPVPLVANSNFLECDAVTDLDGDGIDDLLIRKTVNGFVSYDIPIVWGASSGPHELTFIGTPYTQFTRIAAVDFDRDGVVDLVSEATQNGNVPHEIVVFRGLGSRQFAPPFVLSYEPVGYLGTAGCYVADVDGDQDLDVLRTTFGPPILLVLLRNESIRAPGCPGTGGLVPTSAIGVATPGNQSFAVAVSSALPDSIAVLGVSLAPVAVSGCGVAIDLAQLVLPSGSVGILPTDSSGIAVMPLPLPPPPALHGLAFHVQWGVLDPQGSLPAGGYTFALSDARTVYVW
jgi:FG-GAP-like repeat